MTREQQINDAVKTSITETLISTPNYEFSPRATDMLECAFTKGAEWADAHPVNPWHKVTEELPKVPENARYINVFVRYSNGIVAVSRYTTHFPAETPVLRVTHWMPIPELPKED